MAVDLGDLIDSLRREVNPLGTDAFPDATDDDYLGYLEDAFWECRLDGITSLDAFDDVDGTISPVVVGNADITRTLQQLIVLYGGIRILRNQLAHLNTSFHAEAGPARFEIQKSATLLKGILDELKHRRDIVLTRLSDLGFVPSYISDAIAGREDSIAFGDQYWIGY